MNLWATFIIKDDSELPKFKNCVESVRPYVDGWITVANGEKTAEIKAYVESHGGKYYYLPWNKDFSVQRNFAVSKLPSTCDLYYWQDFDDILIGGDRLRDIAQLALDNHRDVVMFDYWYGCSFSGEPSVETFQKVDVTQIRERLIKPGTHYWKGKLHETPMPVPNHKDNYVKVTHDEYGVAVMHTKTMQSAYETMARNKDILEYQLEEERKKGEADPRTLLYLMKIYAESNEPDYLERCIKMGEEYLQKSGWDEERATCCDLMAVCYNKIGDTNTSIELLHDSLREYPFYPLHYFRLAMAYLVMRKPREARHWVDIGVTIPMDNRASGNTHLQEMKILSSQVILKLSYEFEKNYRAALGAAEVLYKEQPNEVNERQYHALLDLVDLEEACERTDKLFTYLESIGAKKAIVSSLEDLPIAITSQPFAIRWRQKVSPPKVWGEKEICYFANAGGPSFEKWDGNSLKKGIGGSETAVIELSEEFVKRGYSVTVYGDPLKKCTINGVTYLPWYYFNKADRFQTFIQWRGAGLSPEIKCERYLTDLHDLFSSDQLLIHEKSVDAFLVKSEFHKQLSQDQKKFIVINNGIRV